MRVRVCVGFWDLAASSHFRRFSLYDNACAVILHCAKFVALATSERAHGAGVMCRRCRCLLRLHADNRRLFAAGSAANSLMSLYFVAGKLAIVPSTVSAIVTHGVVSPLEAPLAFATLRVCVRAH